MELYFHQFLLVEMLLQMALNKFALLPGAAYVQRGR